MDETLAHAAVDVSGRPYCVHTGEPEALLGVHRRQQLPGGAQPARLRLAGLPCPDHLHVRVLYGRDPHHICEAQYKAIARALRQAVEPDPRVHGIPSTKGVL